MGSETMVKGEVPALHLGRATLSALQLDALAAILPIDPAVAERWGDLMAQARKGGVALSAMDGFFAATALVHDLTLVTRNAKDFAPLGVPMLNPWIGGSGAQ